MITRSRVLDFHPINIYCNKIHEYDDMTFTDYFKRFDMEKICRRNVTYFLKDKLGFHIYETHKITRFTDFHPIHNSEAFFFNVLLRTIPLKNENDFLSATNIEQSFIRECHNREIISNIDNIQEYLLQYVHRNLINIEKQSQLLKQLLEEDPYLNPEHIPQDIHVLTPSSNAERKYIQNEHLHILTTCSTLTLRIWYLLRNNNTSWTTFFKIHMDYTSSQIL